MHGFWVFILLNLLGFTVDMEMEDCKRPIDAPSEHLTPLHLIFLLRHSSPLYGALRTHGAYPDRLRVLLDEVKAISLQDQHDLVDGILSPSSLLRTPTTCALLSCQCFV